MAKSKKAPDFEQALEQLEELVLNDQYSGDALAGCPIRPRVVLPCVLKLYLHFCYLKCTVKRSLSAPRNQLL